MDASTGSVLLLHRCAALAAVTKRNGPPFLLIPYYHWAGAWRNGIRSGLKIRLAHWRPFRVGALIHCSSIKIPVCTGDVETVPR